MKSHTIEHLYSISKQASAYAQSHIVGSATRKSMEINGIDETVRILAKGIESTRQEAQEKDVSPFRLEKNIEFYKFYNDIQVIKKYSLGNCAEYAYLALDYFNQHNKKTMENIAAECFHLTGRDHMLVVVNRDQNSDPSNYQTWNHDVCICDAFTDRVFPASELSEKLNVYEAETGIDDYKFKLIKKLTSFYQAKCHTEENLEDIKNTYVYKIFIMQEFLENFEKQVIARLKKYPHAALIHQLEQIQIIKNRLSEAKCTKSLLQDLDYMTLSQNLTFELVDAFKFLRETLVVEKAIKPHKNYASWLHLFDSKESKIKQFLAQAQEIPALIKKAYNDINFDKIPRVYAVATKKMSF